MAVRASLWLIGCVVFVAGCRGGGDSGAVLYEKACARCHGPDGKGGVQSAETNGVPSRDLSEPAWQATVTDDELRQIIRDGRRTMPAFGHVLSIDKIDSVVKHLRTFAGAAPPPKPAPAPAPQPGYGAPAGTR